MDPTTTEQSPAPAETTQTTQEPSTPSLEEISKEFSVDEQARQFQATPTVAPPVYQPPQQPPQFNVPDPVIDPEGYKRYVWRQEQLMSGVQSQTQQVLSKLNALEQERTQQKIDADVNRAVSKVNEQLKSDPELVEAMLEVEYRKNPTFKFIWDNRDRNPQAFDKALNAIAGKIGPKFQGRHDPQLTENQRAAQASQRTMATTQKTNELEDVARMSQADFDQWWHRQKTSGV